MGGNSSTRGARARAFAEEFMRKLLLATIATAALAIAPVTFAQNTQVPAAPPTGQPVPATPPVATPPPNSGAPAEAAASAAAQAPQRAVAETPPPETQAEATPETPAAQASTSTHTTTASRTRVHSETVASAEAPQTASQVCAGRTTSVHFGAGSSGLSRQNTNAIEYAADAASVCQLQGVVIAAGDGAVAQRRAANIRHVLERQGVPSGSISVDQTATAANQVDVRMNFAGVASASVQPASTPG